MAASGVFSKKKKPRHLLTVAELMRNFRFRQPYARTFKSYLRNGRNVRNGKYIASLVNRFVVYELYAPTIRQQDRAINDKCTPVELFFYSLGPSKIMFTF